MILPFHLQDMLPKEVYQTLKDITLLRSIEEINLK
jgi:hypothetical protein